VILLYGVLYSVIRFVIEFFRDDPRGDVFGLTTLTGLSTSQIVSVIVGISAVILLFSKWRRPSQSTTNTKLPRHERLQPGGG
jgi:prolipoprotein diacylglyceryltransferase